MVEAIKQLGAKLSPDSVLSLVFGCKTTFGQLDALKADTTAAGAYNYAGKALVAMSRRFVQMMKQARWALAAIGVVGGLLTLTGVAAAHAALAVPIAYAVVGAAVVVIEWISQM